jgi:Docking domain of Afi1 for Arf3 in vesicle trafficking
MEHQYPGAISPDENMLAELMLPDQTHVRTQDWTMFFLHKDSGANEEEEAARNARRQRRKERRAAGLQTASEGEEDKSDLESEDDEESDEESDAGEGPPLMYVLNLVNTKQDNSVKR